ncbi:hypothetical protein J7L06_05035 [Candidatus Bathyarchaeota archaeon]|nr:hypothetical protein [Candidatus Bathyarchaeota archaeon]
MIVALFEDTEYENLLPLVYMRPVFGLKAGMKTLFERVEEYFKGSRKALFVREYLVDYVKAYYEYPVNESDVIDEDVLFLNGSLVMDNQLYRVISSKISEGVAATLDGRLLAIHLPERKARELVDRFRGEPWPNSLLKGLPLKRVELTGSSTVRYPWDLVSMNSMLLERDFRDSGLGGVREGYLDPKAVVYGHEENLYLGENSRVEGYVVLDVRKGPIYIGEDVEVHSHSRITGPAYIDKGTKVYSALIREGTSIGPVCRVGGEVSETIFHGFDNKYHSGYIGHSYLCEWVNIGAGTVVSDLKNTYGTVKMRFGDRRVDTKLMKIGCFISDHSKLSIGTMVYSGKRIGFFSHVHGFVTEDVPSFTIWAKSLGAEPVELRLESAIETQRRVYGRRNVKQTEVDVDLLKRIYRLTVEERRKAGVARGTLKL